MDHDNCLIIPDQGMTEILPRLWVGGEGACDKAVERGFKSLCVKEHPHTDKCEHIRILHETTPLGAGSAASTVFLDETRNWLIHNWLLDNCPVLVHCGAGVERSPLTIAWTMANMFNITLDEAYKWIIGRRPIVQNRQAWIHHETLQDFLRKRAAGPLRRRGTSRG